MNESLKRIMLIKLREGPYLDTFVQVGLKHFKKNRLAAQQTLTAGALFRWRICPMVILVTFYSGPDERREAKHFSGCMIGSYNIKIFVMKGNHRLTHNIKRLLVLEIVTFSLLLLRILFIIHFSYLL